MNSTLAETAGRLHVAIIMDGNGRWARARELSRAEGHRAGAEAIRRVAHAAPQLGIQTLTLYAFSGNNWNRPAPEIVELMRLFESFFRMEVGEWIRQSVRVRAIGQRERLPMPLLESIEEAESATRNGTRLRLRIAIDYSAQATILEAARRFGRSRPIEAREEFSRLLAAACHASSDDSDVDFLIRAGGEQRLSDFLLWEIAYAELYFTERLWPDFTARDLETALAVFDSRQRRYGRVESRTECALP